MFTNPSKEAARARREEAKEVMGRELWDTIMEDSSDDDDDGPEEEFYFYDGGWHSSPRPIKDLTQDEQNQSEKDSQASVFDEGSAKHDVLSVESVNKTPEHSAGRVSEDQITTVVNKDDPNHKKHGNSSDFGSVAIVTENVRSRIQYCGC